MSGIHISLFLHLVTKSLREQLKAAGLRRMSISLSLYKCCNEAQSRSLLQLKHSEGLPSLWTKAMLTDVRCQPLQVETVSENVFRHPAAPNDILH